jgi:hypothetical protein
MDMPGASRALKIRMIAVSVTMAITLAIVTNFA